MGPFSSEHQQHAPMWVVSVENVLGMTGTFQPHQVLKAEGLLALWNDEMFTIFVSHKWLGHQHPDPGGDQLKVLQGILRNLIARKVTVQNDFISQFFGGFRTLTESEHRKFKDAFIWLDYCCVPQLERHQEDVNVQDLERLQKQELLLRHVYSIPYYVDVSQAFVALVPKVMHFDTLACSDYYTWLDSGWCRTEFWCKLLSTRSKIPIIVVKSQDVAQFTQPLWFRYPVHSGAFAIESDRATCNQVINTALANHLSVLRQAKKRTAYRLYLALFEEMAGLQCKCRTIESFLTEFGFSCLRHNGLGPAACAALAGDHELLRSLVEAKASVQTHAPGMIETMQVPRMTPLHLACFFRSHDVQTLQTLLELRADVHWSSLLVPTPLHFCRTVNAVELLVRNGAGTNEQGGIMQYCPIHAMAALGVPSEVLARMLELQADVRGREGGLGNSTPLHHIATSGGSNNDLRSAQLLLESKTDLNQVCQPKGPARVMELFFRARCHFQRGEPAAVAKFLANVSTTPLGWCSIYDNEQLLVFLLRARADPEIRDNRGLRPIDFASSANIRRILRCPTQDVYLLEYQSEQISEFVWCAATCFMFHLSQAQLKICPYQAGRGYLEAFSSNFRWRQDIWWEWSIVSGKTAEKKWHWNCFRRKELRSQVLPSTSVRLMRQYVRGMILRLMQWVHCAQEMRMLLQRLLGRPH